MTSRLWRRRARPVLLAATASAVLAVGTFGAADSTAAVSPAAELAASTAASGALSSLPLGALTSTTAAATAAADATTPTAGWVELPAVPNDPIKGVCSNTTGIPYATGLTPLPCLTFRSVKRGTTTPGPTVGASSLWSDNGQLFTPVTQNVPKTGTLLNLPRTLGRVFQISCNTVKSTVPGTSQTYSPLPCPEGFGLKAPPPTNADGTPNIAYTTWIGLAASIAVQSPVGASPQYGIIATLPVSLLAFGSVPATATVTITQPVIDGVATPLKLAWGTSAALYEQGTTLTGFEAYGPAPYPNIPSDDGSGGYSPGNSIAQDLSIDGPISINISNVNLDGTPLDVGTDCHADTELNIYARGGWIPSQSFNGRYPPTPGEQGEYSIYTAPGYLHADVDVPPFRHCQSAEGEDLSPLLTGLVSAVGNALNMTSATPVLNWGCLAGITDTCGFEHPPVIDPYSIKLPYKPGF